MLGSVSSARRELKIQVLIVYELYSNRVMILLYYLHGRDYLIHYFNISHLPIQIKINYRK